MLTSVSVSSVTSITTILSAGVTVGGLVLCLVLVGLLTGKELSVTYPEVDERVKDTLNAAIVPTLFAFLALVGMQVL